MNKDTWGIVLTGGKAPSQDAVISLLAKADRLVAADSGLDLAFSYGVSPDIVVGDMDSLANTDLLCEFAESDVRRYSHEKDETDTEIAIRTLVEDGFDKIGLIGGGGGRLDHLFAIYALFERQNRPRVWITDSGFVVSVDSLIEVHDCVGMGISFFPVGRRICRMQSSGLQWSLDGLRWAHGDCGVSNVITDGVMRVSVKSGRLIMVGDLDVLSGVAL